MATTKKKPAAKTKAATAKKARPKAVKAALPEAVALEAAPAAKIGAEGTPTENKSSKLWMVPVAMLLILAGVGAFLVHHARYLASLKFDMVKEARTIPQGHDKGEGTGLSGIAGDKQGQLFMLEGFNGAPVRLQRFDSQSSPNTLVYDEKGAGKDLTNAVDVDCDAQGNVYVALKDGRVQVLDNNLKYLRTIPTGTPDITAVSVNSAGRVYVAARDQNKVLFFNAKGQKEGEFGTPGTGSVSLVAPTFLRVNLNDEVVVGEVSEAGLRGRIFTKDHTLRKTFLIDKVGYAAPVRMGLNSQNKVFFNDPAGTRGIVVYDISNGRYFGASQSTKDGEQFISPGCIGADRFTPSVYVHTVSGLIKCELPTQEKDAEGDKE